MGDRAPLVFLGTNTLYGGYLNIAGQLLSAGDRRQPARHTEGWILTICTIVMMVLAVIMLGQAIAKWVSVLAAARCGAGEA